MAIGALLLKLPNYKCQYLGEQEPEFNQDSPGDYYSHMVISIQEAAETGMAFPKMGFYRIINLNPGKALFLYQTEEATGCKNGCSV